MFCRRIFDAKAAGGTFMNKMLIAAVLCAVACAGAPAARAAATVTPALSTMTDMQIYCSWAPDAAKCTTPAKPVAAKPTMKKVAMVKPVSAAKPAPVGIKTMSCKPAAKTAGHLYDCVWQTH
jgi:hypothetical protein